MMISRHFNVVDQSDHLLPLACTACTLKDRDHHLTNQDHPLINMTRPNNRHTRCPTYKNHFLINQTCCIRPRCPPTRRSRRHTTLSLDKNALFVVQAQTRAPHFRGAWLVADATQSVQTSIEERKMLSFVLIVFIMHLKFRANVQVHAATKSPRFLMQMDPPMLCPTKQQDTRQSREKHSM